MHPINKNVFGSGVGKMSIQFHNGTSVVTGYIVKQTGTKRFVATVDGVNTFVVTLAPTLAIAQALTAGYANLLVTPASGPAEHVATIYASTLVTLEGNTYRWTLGAAAAPDLVSVASVAPPLAISGIPAAGVVGTAYSFTPVVTGGSGTKAFSLIGTVPAGLTFSNTTGALTGTPTAAGTTTLSIAVTDGSGGSATLSNISIVITAS
jgi:hypothetical protein